MIHVILSAAAISMKAKLPHDFLTMQKRYTIKDPSTLLPALALPRIEGQSTDNADAPPSLCENFIELAKDGTGLSYCGLDASRSDPSQTVVGGFASVENDFLFERTAHEDATSLLRHLEAVKPATDAIAAIAPLADVMIHGPAAAIAECKASLGESGECPSYFTLEGNGFSSLKKVADGVPLTLQLLSVHTTFEVSDWAAAKPLMDAYVDATSTEGGCVFCGFARSGDTLFLREGFGSVPDIGKHYENAGGAMNSLLAGPATLVSHSIHGGRANVLEVKRVFAEGNGNGNDGIYGNGKATIYWKEVGIQRFERVQSLFGFSF